MNPVSYARYLSTMSTTKLSRELKVSKQYISRLEQGLYEKPNKAVITWAAETLNKNSDSPITALTVEKLYKEWQWSQRESTKVNKQLEPVTVTKFDRVSQAAALGGNTNVIYYHKIFGQWVGSYWDSVHSFCVQMCLHPSPVAEYIDGQTYSMPNKLRDVLLKLELIGEGFKTNES